MSRNCPRLASLSLAFFLYSLCLSPIMANPQSFRVACQSAPRKPKLMQTLSILKVYFQVNDCRQLEEKIQSTKVLWLNSRRLEDITLLSYFSHLEQLDLSDNIIENITPLANLHNLRSLWLGENFISNLSPLRGLKELQLLDVEDNQISDLAAVSDLDHLMALDASNNQISDLTPLAQMPALSFLFLSGNQIEDISPLTKIGEKRRCISWSQDKVTPSVDWQCLGDLAYGQTRLFTLINVERNPAVQPIWKGGRRQASIAAGLDSSPLTP